MSDPESKSSVVRWGMYQVGPATIEQQWAYNATKGTLGHGPLATFIIADLRPWEGIPASSTVDYTRLVTPFPSGKGTIRFTYPKPSNIWRPTGGIIYGTSTSQPTWTSKTQAGDRVNRCFGTFVARWDQFDTVEWYTNTATTWDNFFVNNYGQFPENVYMQQGPEILSGMAGTGVYDLDLNDLAGGSRFVAISGASYWVGPDPVNREADIYWEVTEGRSAAPMSNPVSFAFPITDVQDNTGGADQYTDPNSAVAMVNLSRIGSWPFTYTTISSVSVQVGNGCGTALEGYMIPYVGTLQDTKSTPTAGPIIPATATSAGTGDLIETDFVGPYSYLVISVFPAAAAGAVTGPIIVNVTVG